MRWIFPETTESTKDIVMDLLAKRGHDPEVFLTPSLEHIPDHSLLFNSLTAAKHIVEAVEQGKKIFIHGDYDVDGVCATAILWDFLYRKLNADVLPLIPSRFDDGYGLSESTLDQILEAGGQLVITVDCGVKDAEITNRYHEKGLDFVITDHHTLPSGSGLKELLDSKALALVHPQHPKGKYPYHEICGANVSWKLASAVNAYAKLGEDMTEYLDLVAMATVCDVMPLVNENRAIVKFGLQKTINLGIRALLDIADVKPSELQAYHYGFVLGPRINASGRLQTAMDALRLLTTRSTDQAAELAGMLQQLNLERQEITRQLMESAESELQGELSDERLLVAVGEDWPEGIVGLVAGKLTEKYHRPVIVGSIKEGQITGSARSIEGMHIANAFKEIDSLLVKHGGHAQAAGFTLLESNFTEFKQKLQQMAKDSLSEENLERVLQIDMVISAEQIDAKLVAALAALAPHGFGNPNPVFALMQVQIASKRVFGSERNHISFMLDNGIEVVVFGRAKEFSDINSGQTVDIAGNLGVNHWNGRDQIQIKVLDIKA